MEITPLYTDLYQLTMGQVHFKNNQHNKPTVFDYFFRKLPFQGGYVIFSGLKELLQEIAQLRFPQHELEYLKKVGLDKAYVDYLADFRFNGTIYAVNEGEVVFPQALSIRVEGTMLEAQLIETLLLNMINFQSLIATKAARIRQVAPGKILADFGLRRAQGLGGYHASRSTLIGGFNSTSNVKAAMDFEVPPSGTMAHAFIQHYEDELTAFRAFADGRPEHCILLVDTYDTLKSGVPNAIMVAREMEKKGHRLEGIRLDSGDLAYLAIQSRKMLDVADLPYVKIAASNQLDEHVIKSLIEQEAPIDIYGVGTNLVTGQPDAALDGVYKLSFSDGKPRIKLSESLIKTTLPARKQVFRIYDEKNKFWGADAIALVDEPPIGVMHHPFEPEKSVSLKDLKQEPLLVKVMENGTITGEQKTIREISDFSSFRLSLLPKEFKRFENPHVYKVGISTRLKQLRDNLRLKFTENESTGHR
jgi:nicotinate phosphoribosyltransferase